MIRHWVVTPLPGKYQEAVAWAKERAAYIEKLLPEEKTHVYGVAIGDTRQIHMTTELDEYAAIDRNLAGLHGDDGFMDLWARREDLLAEISNEIWVDL